ncbi:hypothetical protein BJ085DRAFT_15809 [Dimargaris cristalligena]|uniref:Uncharacterized protein n=1 Tax=Dimargaris cristalligena TaxID=215637 RepID=A0A4P9ZTD6_9FUNG|nr:hypothetical protein BJ085DRAFT_15809 [Dimargaris cristalligena]|eukprot:RKP36846.1 hypothetical protein BJ085DRAFT_15809 [Dimargaris cristalligena]
MADANKGVVTVRLIKSFEYRTFKNVVLKNIDFAQTTVGDLKKQIQHETATGTGMRPFRTVEYDTLKIYTKAHGSKTNNLIVNLDRDDWVLKNDADMLDYCGIANETELSYFNRAAFEEFKKNPEVKW